MRRLPNGKPVSGLGFGCSSLWSHKGFPDSAAKEILEAAMAEGINHFDTSPSYGPAHAERRLGNFLNGLDLDRIVVSTKVGSNLIAGSIVRGFSRALMERSFEESLARLGLRHVDILYLHGPRVEDINHDVFDFFDRLKAAGTITYSGVNSFDNDVLSFVAGTAIDAVMLQYNVADVSADQVIEKLHAAGKIVISGTALARAKFTLPAFVPRDRGSAWYLLRMMRHEPFFWLEAPRLKRRLSRLGGKPAEVAIQFVTGNPLILSNFFGSSRAEHVIQNARAGHRALTERERAIVLGTSR